MQEKEFKHGFGQTKEKVEPKDAFQKEFDKIKSIFIAPLAKQRMALDDVPFKSVLIGMTIEEANAAFENLSKCAQIREIALDALGLMTFTATVRPAGANNSSRHYWGTELLEKFRRKKSKKDFQKELLEQPPACTVCQRGAYMLSQARVSGCIDTDNDTKFSMGTDGVVIGLSNQDMIDMENDYEGRNIHYSNYDGANSKMPYGHNTKEKLANLMCNILANCGFNREDTTDYLKKWNITLPKTILPKTI